MGHSNFEQALAAASEAYASLAAIEATAAPSCPLLPLDAADRALALARRRCREADAEISRIILR